MPILLLNILCFTFFIGFLVIIKYNKLLIGIFKCIYQFCRLVYFSKLNPMIIIDLIKHFGEIYFPNLKNKWKTHSLVKTGKIYTLKFEENGTKYSIKFTSHRKPLRILSVEYSTDKGDVLDTVCVTDKIYEYLGPGRNFYGIPTTPKLLGYENLKFTLTNGKVCIFDKDEIINIECLS